MPDASVLSASVAVPLFSGALPSDVEPSMKVTLPVGDMLPVELTLAVRVTLFCTNTAGALVSSPMAAVALLPVPASPMVCMA